MRKLGIMIGAVLMGLVAGLMATAAADLPSDVVNANREVVPKVFTRDIINPMDPGYIWGNPYAVKLSGTDPVIFDNMAFRKDPGGMASAGLYTPSINDFRSADPDAGASNVTKKVARVGMVHWP